MLFVWLNWRRVLSRWERAEEGRAILSNKTQWPVQGGQERGDASEGEDRGEN